MRFYSLLLGIVGLLNFSFADDSSQKCACDYAQKYTGFDMNLGVGYSALLFHETDTTATTTEYDQGGRDGAALQLKAGLHYGFLKYFLIGLETYGQYNSAQYRWSYFAPGVNSNAHFSVHWDLGFDARLGFVVWPSNLFYITIGPDWGNAISKYVTDEGITRINAWFVGPRLGVGAEQKLTHWLVIRESFDYVWYDSKSQVYHDDTVASGKPYLATFLFSLGVLL